MKAAATSGLTRRGLVRGAAAGLVGGLLGPALGAGLAAEAAGLSKASIAARRRFFGTANVDPRTGRVRRDRVILSWFGVTNFAMAIDGRVVLLDAWVPRGLYSGRVPTSPRELALLRPSHVFIGHGHFDHAADAGPIVAATGATVVGTTSHVAQVAEQVGRPIRSVALDLRSDGDVKSFGLGERIRVSALRHPHSSVAMPSGEYLPMLPIPDFTPALTHPPTLPDLLHVLTHQADEQGGAVLYRFQFGRFSLTWNDSAGPLRDAPRAEAALRRLPRSTVQVGAIQGFGQVTNGLRDPLDYIRAVRPQVFVPGHHDNWLPPISEPAAHYEKPLRAGLARIPVETRPRLVFLRDPEDYISPRRLTFAV